MSATSTDTTAAALSNETAPQALIRIAIPSFKLGWGKSALRNKVSKRGSREEFQSLINEDLLRSLETKVVLTPEERREYEMAMDIRAALYGKHH